jgi:hypothetical protein
MIDYRDEWEKDKEKFRERANSIIDKINLPLDHTYVWRIEPVDGSKFRYGSTKSGLRSALWNCESDLKVRIVPLIKFETIYDDNQDEITNDEMLEIANDLAGDYPNRFDFYEKYEDIPKQLIKDIMEDNV